MKKRFWFNAAVLLLLVSPVALARVTILHIQATDTTIDIRAVKQHGKYFVSGEDLQKKLNVAVKADTAATLIILSSLFDCVPVFAGYEQDVTTAEKTLFIRWDLAAKALGTTATVQKNAITLEYPFSTLLTAHVGSEVGDQATGFVLKAEKDSSVDIKTLRQDHPALLLFVRSGAWDPQSKWLLRAAQSRSDSLRGAGVSVAAIHGYESKEAAKWTKAFKLSFPLLPDPFAAVMRSYDVFDQGHLPFNAIFLLDKNGVIRLRQVFTNPDEMPDMNTIMQEIKNLP